MWIAKEESTWELIKIRYTYTINESTMSRIYNKWVDGTRLWISAFITQTYTCSDLTENKSTNTVVNLRILIQVVALS